MKLPVFARYVVVGSAAFAVDALALALFMGMGAGPGVARALAFLPALMTGFLLNRGWTFAARGEGHWWQHFLRYCGVQIGGIATNSAVYAAVLIALQREDRTAALVALALGSLAAMGVTFVGSLRLVFAARA